LGKKGRVFFFRALARPRGKLPLQRKVGLPPWEERIFYAEYFFKTKIRFRKEDSSLFYGTRTFREEMVTFGKGSTPPDEAVDFPPETIGKARPLQATGFIRPPGPCHRRFCLFFFLCARCDLSISTITKFVSPPIDSFPLFSFTVLPAVSPGALSSPFGAAFLLRPRRFFETA